LAYRWRKSGLGAVGTKRDMAGFTVIEALVALAVLASTLGAVAQLTAFTHKLGLTLEKRLALEETAKQVLTDFSAHRTLENGVQLRGTKDDQTWRLSTKEYPQPFVDHQARTAWIPEDIVIDVRQSTGEQIRVETVRLVKRPSQ
jgi:general secretion pathway protein I